jgi:hypothetical protein
VAIGQILCKHARCRREVRPDGRGGWIHLSGSYACRDKDYVELSTSAEPDLPPPGPPSPPEWPPLNPWRHR